MVTERQPYVGPRPFEKEDREYFFGRERETTELLSLIVANPVVLLYAQSGAGKTSLLNASLVPKLEAEGYEVLPPARVSGVKPHGLEPNEVANIFVDNVLTSWIHQPSGSQSLARTSLAHVLSERPHQTDEEGLPALRVVILDQFEEIFTSYPESSEQRRDFFRQLRLALEGEPERRPKAGTRLEEAGAGLKGDSLLRVLLVIREDYLAPIEAYAPFLPEKLRTRFRLERLREEAALAAATGPLQKAGSKHRFAPGVAEKLIADLMKVRVEVAAGQTEVVTGEFVEPVQLQVVCQRLFAALPDDATEITDKDLAGFGDVSKALSLFYEDCLARAIRGTNVREWNLRMWFTSALITSTGTRSTVYRGALDTGGIVNAAVDVLEDLHLIRGERRAGAKWYELTHDRLIDPIQESNRKWLSGRMQLEQMRGRLSEKTAEWVRLGRGRGGLLDEVELYEVERMLADPVAAELDLGADQQNLIQQSRDAISETKREKEAAEREKEAAATRELELARTVADEQRRRAKEQARAAKYARLSAAALLVLLSFGFASAVLYWKSSRRDLAEVRLSQLLAARSSSLLDDQLDLALLLSVGAYQAKSEIFESRSSLLASLAQSRDIEVFMHSRRGKVLSVAFGPKGLLATGDENKIITLWDCESYQQRGELKGHDKVATSLAFSPDGKMLVSGSRDGEVILWDTSTDRPLHTLPGGAPAKDLDTVSAAFSPDAKLVALGRSDSGIELWDLEAQKLIPLAGPRADVTCVAFNHDGSMLASGGRDKTLLLWEVATRRRLDRLKGHTLEVTGVTFSPDGSRIVSGSKDGTVLVWDVKTRRQRSLFTIPDWPLSGGEADTKPPVNVAFVPGSSRLAVAGGSRILLWDLDTDEKSSLVGHSLPVNSIAFSPDGKLLASGSDDKKLILWAISDSRSLASPLPDHEGSRVSGLAFSPNGEMLALGGWDTGVILWDVSRRKPLWRKSGSVYSLAFSHDGAHLAWGVQSGAILRNLGQKGEWPLLEGQSRVTSVAFSPDNKILALGRFDGPVTLWDLNSNQQRGELIGHEKVVTSLAFSPNGTMLVSGSKDQTVVLWDVAGGNLRFRFKGHQGPVSSVAFSQDGGTIASGGQDGLFLWNALSAQQAAASLATNVAVTSIAFSPDRRTLASGSQDGNVTLWYAAAEGAQTEQGSASYQKLGVLPGSHKAAVYSLVFSPDGRLLTSGSGGNNRVIIWDVDPDSWAQRACRLANRNLTSEEARQYFGTASSRTTCPNLP